MKKGNTPAKDFSQWQEQRNAAMCAALKELMDAIVAHSNNTQLLAERVASCKKLLEDY